MQKHVLAKALLPALALVLMASAAVAVPHGDDAGTDPIGRLLVDKGLLEAASANAATEPAPANDDLLSQVRQARDGASEMVLAALNFLGVAYRRGGNGADDQGFDCSGFTRRIALTSLGLVLPRRVDEQAGAAGLVAVGRDDLQPGDLVFFNTLRRTFSHVGIYIGDGRFIHAPRPGGEVRVESMRLGYWTQRFTGARRAEAVAPDRPTPLPTAKSAYGLR